MREERKCRCGSGKPQYPLTDAAGIFCCYVCEACEADKRKGYNPAIFRSRSQYALSGDEQDIGNDEEDF